MHKRINVAIIALVALLGWAPLARGQGVRYDNIVLNAQGRPAAFATVRVCSMPASGQPCTPLASIYADIGLSMPLANPLATDALGNYTFYGAPGLYEIEIGGSGLTAKQFPNVSLPSNPTSPTFANVTVGSPPAATTLGTAATTARTATFPDNTGMVAELNANQVFTGQNAVSTYRVNGQGTVVDGNKYACTSAGINQAIADTLAITNPYRVGGTVDASACVGNLTMNAQISVGDAAQDPITYIGPVNAQWTFTMTDGTSCGIMQYAGSTIRGPGVGGGALTARWTLSKGAGSNLFATYCTRYAQTGLVADEGYFYAEGFLTYNPNSVTTASGYDQIIAGAFDNSTWRSIQSADGVNNGIWVYSLCCGTAFYSITANDAGGVPLTVGKNGSNTSDVSFYSPSIDHPKAGSSNIKINTGTSLLGLTASILFHNLYMEGTCSPSCVASSGNGSSAPMVDLDTNVFNIVFEGGVWNTEVPPAAIAASPTGLTESGTTVTVNTTATCYYVTGQQIAVQLAGVVGYNGTWTVLTPGCNGGSSFTYTNTASGLAASGGGSVLSGVPVLQVESTTSGASNVTVDSVWESNGLGGINNLRTGPPPWQGTTGLGGSPYFNAALLSYRSGAMFIDKSGSGAFAALPPITTNGTLGCQETSAPTGIAGYDLLFCDSTAHRLKMINNNGGADTIVGAATTDTLTNKTLTSPVINGGPTGTGVPTLTLKKGTGGGNYSSASTTFAAVDATNLSYSVTIPTGWKLGIQISGAVTTSTAVATASVGINDGSCGGSTVNLQRIQAVPTAAANPESFSLSSVITGDGASHTINLCYLTSNAADSVTVLNSAADLTPTMTFNLMPSN